MFVGLINVTRNYLRKETNSRVRSVGVHHKQILLLYTSK